MNQYQIFLGNGRELIVNAVNHSAALESAARAYPGVPITGWTLLMVADDGIPEEEEVEAE